MKIRFMKKLTPEELDQHLLSGSEDILFSSCDEVQIKLTKLEIGGLRLYTSSDSMGERGI